MRTAVISITTMISLLVGTSSAELHEVPYTGGKKSGTVVITKLSNTQMSPDTIKIGSAVIRLKVESDILPAVCGAKPTIIAQFSGGFSSAWQTADSSTAWNTFSAYPATGLIQIDSIEYWDGASGMPAKHANAIRLFSAGSNNSCSGEEYFMHPQWNRVVFMRLGSGVDYRMKVSFQAKHDTSYSLSPMLHYNVLKSLTMHYVLNMNSTDVSGAPVSIRAPRASRVPTGRKDWRTVDLYSPLGVKLNREPGRFEALVPARR